MKQVGNKRTRTRWGSLFLFSLMLLSLVVFADVSPAQADDLPTITVTPGIPASGQLESHGPVKGIFQWTYDGETFSLVALSGEFSMYGMSYDEFEEQLMRNEIAYLAMISAVAADIPDYDDLERDVDDPGYRPPDREIWDPDEDPTVIDEDDISWGDPETQFAVMHVYDAGGNLNPDQFQVLASPQLLPSEYRANSIVNTDYFAMPIPGYLYDPALPGNGFIQLSADMPYVFVFYVPEASITGPAPQQPPPPPATQAGNPGFKAPKPAPQPQGPAIDQLPAGSAPPSPQGVDTGEILDWWEEEGGEMGESRRPRPKDKDEEADKDEPEEPSTEDTEEEILYGFINVLFIDDATDEVVASMYIEAFPGDYISQAMLWGWRGMINIGPEWELIPDKSTPGFTMGIGEMDDEYMYMRQRNPEEDTNRLVIFNYYLLYPDTTSELKATVIAPTPIQSQYSLAEAEALYTLLQGFVYSPSPSPNPGTYGPIPPEQSYAQFAVYFEYEDPSCVDRGDCPDFTSEDEAAQVMVRHLLASGNNPVLLEWEALNAKIGEAFTLDQLKKDYTSLGIYVMPVPPNKAIYKVNAQHEIFDIWYYLCEEDVPSETPNAPPTIVFPPKDCTPTPDCHECWDPPHKTIQVPPVDQPWQPGLEIAPPTKGGDKPSQKAIDKHEWRSTYDVIVYGLDAGGAVAAITAAEEGARVLVIDPDKASDTGGYTRFCKQNILYTEDAKGAEQFFSALRGQYDHLDQDFVKVLAQGAADVPQWLNHHLAKTLHDVPYVQYSELAGGDKMKILRLSDKSSFDQSFYTLLLENLKAIEKKTGPYKAIKGSINYSYSTHLIQLIQDPKTKTILGVEVEHKGETYKVRATNGVILASGGFQNNEDMVENYLEMPEVQAKFKNKENGDGILAAQKVGAALWHMGNAAAYELHFKPTVNSSPPSMLGSLQGFRTHQTGDRPCFIVGPNGYRVVNEAADLRLGHNTPAGEWVMQQLPGIAWVIFDEAGLTQVPLYPGWSQDNLAEVKKGWIIEAEDMEELAKKLGVDPLNLEDQFLDYQDFCDNGYDPQFHRPNKQMKKLSEEGPYYALPVIPTIHHTLGGPEKNTAAEVIDLWGKVIPHLYSTGNIGSVYPDIFPEGGDLTECIIFGRIAGTNAAKKK